MKSSYSYKVYGFWVECNKSFIVLNSFTYLLCLLKPPAAKSKSFFFNMTCFYVAEMFFNHFFSKMSALLLFKDTYNWFQLSDDMLRSFFLCFCLQ